MTEIEKKAEEYINTTAKDNYKVCSFGRVIYLAYKDGYEQGQKDFDTDVTKLLNSYGVTFIDTNSIGGLIALHQLILDLEKENEELKAQIEKMKCCQNCKHYIDTSCELEAPIKCKYWYSMIINATDEWELAK